MKLYIPFVTIVCSLQASCAVLVARPDGYTPGTGMDVPDISTDQADVANNPSDALDEPSGACPVGQDNCGMAGCVDLQNSRENCGRCGLVCPTPMANNVATGAPRCIAGACSPTCILGYERLGVACIPERSYPRPIRPLSLGDVSLRRPTLRWRLPFGADGAVVQLCRDRACTMEIESLRVVGIEVRPSAELPPRSVVFWRLRTTVGAATSMTYSPTWLFHVPATNNSTGIDTSTHPHMDVNGDGFDDVIVGASTADSPGLTDNGRVTVYHGSMMGISANPDFSAEGGAANNLLGASVAAAGDVDGDGFGDVIVGEPGASPGAPGAIRALAGAARLYFGSPTGLSSMLVRPLGGGDAADRFGSAVTSLGDADGDGFADFAIASPFATQAMMRQVGMVGIFLGRADRIISSRTRNIVGQAADDQFGSAISGGGDINGDGLSDAVFGAPTADFMGRSDTGKATIYFGTANGQVLGDLGMASTTVYEGSNAGDQFGNAVSMAGDVNNDGYGDVAIGAALRTNRGRVMAGTVSVYHGRAVVLPVGGPLLGGTIAGGQFGNAISAAGDINGDGFDDLVVGAHLSDLDGMTDVGIVSVHHGGMMGASQLPAAVRRGTFAAERFGTAVAAGDLNRDGFADVIVGAILAPSDNVPAGTAAVFYGTDMGLPSMPTLTLRGAAAGDNFGISVATAGGLVWGLHRRADTRSWWARLILSFDHRV